MASEQDTTTCAVCGRPLDHAPKLGEWIMHEVCQQATMRYVCEAEQRGREHGTAHERSRILRLALAGEEQGVLSAGWLSAAAHATIEYGPVRVTFDGEDMHVEQDVRIVPPLDRVRLRISGEPTDG